MQKVSLINNGISTGVINFNQALSKLQSLSSYKQTMCLQFIRKTNIQMMTSYQITQRNL